MPMTISIDDELKEQFKEVCKEIGLSTSAAIGIFAKAVVRERCIPFTVAADAPAKAAETSPDYTLVQVVSSPESTGVFAPVSAGVAGVAAAENGAGTTPPRATLESRQIPTINPDREPDETAGMARTRARAKHATPRIPKI